MNKKNTILLVIVVSLIVGGSFLYTQNNDTVEHQIQQDDTETLPNVDIVEVVEEKNQEIENIDILYDDSSIDTLNWKTYRNEEYGFEVKYPEGWKIEMTSDIGDLVISLIFDEINHIDFYPAGGGVEASSRPYMQKSFRTIINGTYVDVREWGPESGYSDFGYDYSYDSTISIFYFGKEKVSNRWRNDARIKVLYDKNSKNITYKILNTIQFFN